MQTYVARGGRQLGNYGEEQLRSLYERGHLLPTDHYWREGMSEWSTLGELLPAKPVLKVEPRPVEVEETPKAGWLILLVSVGGAMLVGLLLLSFIISHHEQKTAAREFVTREKKIAADNEVAVPAPSSDITPPPAPSVQPAPPPASTSQVTTTQVSGEVEKLQNLSKDQTPAERNLTEETVALIQDIAKHGQACRDAESTMLQLGFAPGKLTSLSEIDKRRDAIQNALPTLQGMITYITEIDTRIRADLTAKGASPTAIDAFITGMHQSGKTEALLTYWKEEIAISTDLLANLDLLKKHYGDWHVEADKVVFNDTAILALYQANIEKLKADIAAQQSVQAEITKSSGP